MGKTDIRSDKDGLSMVFFQARLKGGSLSWVVVTIRDNSLDRRVTHQRRGWWGQNEPYAVV